MPGKAAACQKETVQGFGAPVIIQPNARAKRLILRLDIKKKGFVLTVPAGFLREDAIQFLKLNTPWMDRVIQEELCGWDPAFLPGERHMVLGKQITLGRDGLPAGRDFLKLRMQLAETYVREILPGWEQRMGVRIPRIRWRDMTSRWGSCNVKTGEIHLSTRLQMYPPACIELVLVHEMCHMHHHNHSAAFHEELNRLIPDTAQREYLLRRFDPKPLPPETDRDS